MKSIIIKRNPNGDTRTAKDTSYERFSVANAQHIEDVSALMKSIAKEIEERGYRHDFTKITEEYQFYSDFVDTIKRGADFISGKWYQNHIKEERHHLLSNCPKDVNLIDVIEMVCDCVAAGLARSGEVRKVEISNNILQNAVNNTINMLKNRVKIAEV